MTDARPLSTEDKFAIFEQMNLHQVSIDTGWGAPVVRRGFVAFAGASRRSKNL